MCTCVYENSVMVKHYGPMAFFFTVTSLLTVGSFVNRGAFVSPLAPIEAFLYGIIGPTRTAGASISGGNWRLQCFSYSANSLVSHTVLFHCSFRELHKHCLQSKLQDCISSSNLLRNSWMFPSPSHLAESPSSWKVLHRLSSSSRFSVI
ncbi:hypothetical protein OSTOST_25459, partial [Ostertagia ostertagi]